MLSVSTKFCEFKIDISSRKLSFPITLTSEIKHYIWLNKIRHIIQKLLCKFSENEYLLSFKMNSDIYTANFKTCITNTEDIIIKSGTILYNTDIINIENIQDTSGYFIFKYVCQDTYNITLTINKLNYITSKLIVYNRKTNKLVFNMDTKPNIEILLYHSIISSCEAISIVTMVMYYSSKYCFDNIKKIVYNHKEKILNSLSNMEEKHTNNIK